MNNAITVLSLIILSRYKIASVTRVLISLISNNYFLNSDAKYQIIITIVTVMATENGFHGVLW